jgi:hypothetical protein
MKQKLPATERILVICGSIIDRFHCIIVVQAKIPLLVDFFPTSSADSFPLGRKIVLKLNVYYVGLGGNNGN